MWSSKTKALISEGKRMLFPFLLVEYDFVFLTG